jgi:predicted N-acetyltransferase YhbS
MEISIVSGDEVYREEAERQVTSMREDTDSIFVRLKYVLISELSRETLVVARDKGKIVGAIGLQKSPYEEGIYWLKYVSVEESYKNQGLATQLYEEAIKFVQSEGYQIERSSVTPDGRAYLTGVVSRLNEKYPGVIKNPPEDEFSPPGAMI